MSRSRHWQYLCAAVENTKRINPDFVVLNDGIVLVVGVDGDTFSDETPAEAPARTTARAHQRAMVETVCAMECESAEKAAAYVQYYLRHLHRYEKFR